MKHICGYIISLVAITYMAEYCDGFQNKQEINVNVTIPRAESLICYKCAMTKEPGCGEILNPDAEMVKTEFCVAAKGFSTCCGLAVEYDANGKRPIKAIRGCVSEGWAFLYPEQKTEFSNETLYLKFCITNLCNTDVRGEARMLYMNNKGQIEVNQVALVFVALFMVSRYLF